MEAKPYKIPYPFRKLSKELIDVICKDLDEGSHPKYAAEANGITERIFLIWLKQGKIDIEHEMDSLPAYLVRSLAKIRQKEIKRCRKNIESNEKGHKGAEWTLEHAYWRQFCNNAPLQELARDIKTMQEDHGDQENGKA